MKLGTSSGFAPRLTSLVYIAENPLYFLSRHIALKFAPRYVAAARENIGKSLSRSSLKARLARSKIPPREIDFGSNLRIVDSSDASANFAGLRSRTGSDLYCYRALFAFDARFVSPESRLFGLHPRPGKRLVPTFISSHICARCNIRERSSQELGST